MKITPSSSTERVLWRVNKNPDGLEVGDGIIGEPIGGDEAMSPVEYCLSICNDTNKQEHE